MNITTTRSRILVTALLAGLTSIASAQALTGAANAASQAATRITTTPPPPPPPPAPPPAPAVSIGTAAQGAAATVVRAPAAPPASAGSTGAINSGVSGSATKGVNANATTNASATGQARGLTVASAASRQASVTVNTSETVALIKQAAFTTRDTVTTEVQARIDASVQVVAGLEVKAEQGSEQSRAALAKALVEVRAREKELRSSLRDAAMTTKESAWGEIQSALAKNYGAYAKAVAEAVAEAEVAADATAGAK